SPFGQPTVSRTNQPQLPEYLYALSASDGADQTRTTTFGPAGEATPGVTYDGVGYGDPTRNGEPFGELGLVRQQDAAWQDQTGAPRDPQAGNTPGGQRTQIFQARFNGNGPSGMVVDSGSWSTGGGTYSSNTTSGDAVSLLYTDQWLPSYVETSTNVQIGSGGSKQNAFIIFGYQG